MIHNFENLFAAFDVFPSAKGASTHIAHTVQAIQKQSGSITLACLGYGDMPRYQEENNIRIRRSLSFHPNFLKRTELYSDFLTMVMDKNQTGIKRLHFRDIWSGIPLLSHPNAASATKIFEVNGFASIELPVHYPALFNNKGLVNHLKQMEAYCLSTADIVITVSKVNFRHIRDRGVEEKKIKIIPNMAAVNSRNTIEMNQEPNVPHILYSGTLTPWQGIPTLINAFDLLCHDTSISHELILACSTKKYLRPLMKLIKKQPNRDRVNIKIGMSKSMLTQHYHNASFTIAPLARCDRNELQGCCPIKILESMAAGTPVIASDIAVCREIIQHRKDGWLVTPDSPRSLAHAMITLLKNPDLVQEMGNNARKKIETHFSQQHFETGIEEVYKAKVRKND